MGNEAKIMRALTVKSVVVVVDGDRLAVRIDLDWGHLRAEGESMLGAVVAAFRAVYDEAVRQADATRDPDLRAAYLARTRAMEEAWAEATRLGLTPPEVVRP